MHTIQRPIVGPVLLSLLALCIAASTARAQYIYLDTNADGVHDASDAVATAGATSVDVWLVTNADRNGSPVVCPSGPEPVDLSGYEVVLHATNGTVVWGAFQNQIASFTTTVGTSSNATDARAGFSSGTPLPAGAYRVGSITLTVASGTPGITFATSTVLSVDAFTGFHSSCAGPTGEYVFQWGRDFSDADGIPYGGTPNQPPVLAPIADMTVEENTVAEQTITASDPEGQPIQFSKVSGPAYLTVTTTDPGTGVGAGTVRVAPPTGSTEVATATVAASDGLGLGQASFTVTVPIAVAPIADVVVVAYDATSRNITVTDPSGPPLVFTKVSGPPFTLLRVTGPRSAELAIEPGVNDAGQYACTVRVSDGVTSSERSFAITVSELPPCAPGLCLATQKFEAGDAPFDMAVGDFNTDGNSDIVTANQLSNTLGLLLGHGNGRFERVRMLSVKGPQPTSLAVGDVDEDGNADIAVAETGYQSPGLEGHDVSILFGDGAGSFPRQVNLPVAPCPNAIALGDFDEDGHLDLVVSVSPSFTPLHNTLSLYRGRGDGTFGAAESIPNTWPAEDLAVLDANGDGHLDFAYATYWTFDHCVDVVFGRGDGTFDSANRTPGSVPPYAVPGYAYSIAVGDVNGDRISDALVGGAAFSGSTWSSVGTLVRGATSPPLGISTPIALLGTNNFFFVPHVAIGDLTGDGRPDVLASIEAYTGSIVASYARPDGSYGPSRSIAGTLVYPRTVVVADFDHDGRQDLAVSEYGWIFAHVYMNRGYVPIPATVTLAPVILGAGAAGGTLRASIELPTQYDLLTVDLSTIRLDDTVAPGGKTTMIGDLDRDGIPDLTVYFPRASLPSLPVGMHEFKVTGELLSGEPFAGKAAVRIVGQGGHGGMALRVVSPLGATPVAFATERAAATHSIEVFDVHGRLVRRWSEVAGEEGLRAAWDGRNADGGRCGSGVYFVRVKSGADQAVARAVIMR